MLGSRRWIKVRDQRRHVILVTALAGTILLVGFSCHHPEALGLAAGHTHMGQPSVEHCWTAIVGLPTISFVAILVALLSLTPTFQGYLFLLSLFKPPRAYPPIPGWSIRP